MTSTTTATPSDSELSSRWDAWSEEGLPTSVPQRLGNLHLFTTEALTDLGKLTGELEDLVEDHHPVSAVDLFLAGATDHEESCDRRATVRLLERVSQLPVDPLPWRCLPHTDPNLRRRTLTPIERGLVRHCARATAQRTGVIGLLDSGASSGELGSLDAAAFTLDEGTVVAAALPGTCRDAGSGYPQAQPRPVAVAEWSRPALTRLVGAVETGPILYSGTSQDRAKIQSAVLMVARTVLREAGLHQDPTVRPHSIRNTFGRAFYDATGDLLGTTDALGHDDLSFVAREIGLRSHRARS